MVSVMGVRVVWNVFVDSARIVHIDMHADAETIGTLAVAPVTQRNKAVPEDRP
jgi:hypothetical protein